MNKLPIQYSEKFGVGGKPVIFLHGLLGSSRNWRSVAKHLEKEFQIHCLDLRNHGNSFHHQDSSILAMAQDLHAYICENKLESVILCGHSLGGKVAMRFACDYPSLLSGLAIVDIAPRDYPPEHHVPTLEALLSLDLHSIDSRKNADEMLSQKIPNWAFRQFLLTNLVQEGNSFTWKPNLQRLRDFISELSSNPLTQENRYYGPTIFIRGGKSGYLRSEHIPDIMEYFPSASIKVLPDAGHDVHVEDRAGFLSFFEEFLKSLD